MVYLDNAASTPVAPEALAALVRAAQDLPANPSSAHGLGAAAARALEAARAEVATLLHAAPADLVFTSGGTEANALAVLGAAAIAVMNRHAMRMAETLNKGRISNPFALLEPGVFSRGRKVS